MLDLSTHIPSAHSSNPTYLGPRSHLTTPPPESSSSTYAPTYGRPLPPDDGMGSELDLHDGLDDGLDDFELREILGDAGGGYEEQLTSLSGVGIDETAVHWTNTLFAKEERIPKYRGERLAAGARLVDIDAEMKEMYDAWCTRKRARQMDHERAMGCVVSLCPEEEMDEEESDEESVDEMEGRTEEERQLLENEMRDLEDAVVGLEQDYRLVDRLGEGTFSSVYKAIDLRNSDYDNRHWLSDAPDKMASSHRKRRKVYVALKRIYVTSSPVRIENEVSILEDLRGCSNISQVITAFRHEDQIIVVMPFHCNDDFRNYYRTLSSDLLRCYFRELFRALRATHVRGIIHRDVKPANFLFDETDGSGILVDFGLAQRYHPPNGNHHRCQHTCATFDWPHGRREVNPMTSTVDQAIYDARKRSKWAADRVGFPTDDKRPSVKANRAGTRGFRAPEVLLKCPDQTVGIDVWSAGIILLSILSRKFPIFNSNDDTEALMEIATIFGKARMEKCARVHSRTLLSNVPAIDHAGHSLEAIILKTNPDLWTPHESDPDPDNHKPTIALSLDFLKQTLQLDPCKRITASQALRHPFLQREGVDEDEDGPCRPEEAVCGRWHQMNEDGSSHIVTVGGGMHEVAFGEGIAFGTNPCPIHAIHGY